MGFSKEISQTHTRHKSSKVAGKGRHSRNKLGTRLATIVEKVH